MFNSIASRYELVNTLISGGFYKYWNRLLIDAVLRENTPNTILDLCCGTGIVASLLQREMRKRHLPLPPIDCVDFSPDMLAEAKKNLGILQTPIRFIEAAAECLPVPSNSYEAVTLAYGIRNLIDRQAAIREVARVLTTSGNLYILELTPPTNPYVYAFHSIYLNTVVPILGGLLTGQFKAYRYLQSSIRDFSVPPLINLLNENGFQCRPPVTSCMGIVTFIQAKKL